MVRIILGVIAGFVCWTVIWLGSDEVLRNSLAWYAAEQTELERAMFNKDPFAASMAALLISIVRSIFASLLSGFVAALVAGENRRSTFWLGLVLLLVGVMVEVMAWNQLPLWYHFIFLFLLIPVTIAGGRLRKTQLS